MINYLITLSALTAAVILLRGIFRKKISQRIIYAMWLLVVLRMCLPFTLFHYELPEKNIPGPIVSETTEDTSVFSPTPEATTPNGITTSATDPQGTVVSPPVTSPSPSKPAVSAPIKDTEVFTREIMVEEKDDINVSRILSAIWITVSIIVFVWYAATYTVFTVKLRRERVFHSRYGILKVYVSKKAASPCISGIIPAIYINESSTASADLLYILAHEHTHFKHGDNIWSVIRILACSIFWWNPLIWAAAILSKMDAELACDESVVCSCSENDRISYANAIINSIPKRKSLAPGFVNGSVKERLTMLNVRRKESILLTVAVVLLAVICVGCSYTGPADETPPEDTENEVSDGKVTYNDVLKLCRKIADSYHDGSILIDEDTLAYDRLAPIGVYGDNDYPYNWSCMLVDNISYYSSGEVIDFGYSLYDINKDGTNELIWMRLDRDYYDGEGTLYKILAIYTEVDGEAKYIDSYFNRYSAVIVDEGIFTYGSGGIAYTNFELSQLKANSSELSTIIEFGCDGYRDDNETIPNYYRKVDNQTVEITEEEFGELYDEYSCSDLKMSKKHMDELGMKYTSLYSGGTSQDPAELFDEESKVILENDPYGNRYLLNAFLSKDIVTCADYANVPTAMIEGLNTVEFGNCSFRKVTSEDGGTYHYIFEFSVVKSDLDSLPVGDYTYSLDTMTNLHFTNENFPKLSDDNFILDNFIGLLANYCMPEIEGDEQYSKNNYLNGICATAMNMKIFAYPDSVPITKDLSKHIVYDLFGIDDFKIPSEVGHFKDGIFNFKSGWQYPTNVIFELSDVTHESGKYTIDVQFYADMLRLVPSHKVRYEIVEADNIFGYRLVNVSFISRSKYDRGFAPSV